jgi:8-hydroxy-5-deazaflavin:NADPH oxidoreductase
LLAVRAAEQGEEREGRGEGASGTGDHEVWSRAPEHRIACEQARSYYRERAARQDRWKGELIMANIAILGSGNVGSALARGLTRAGHDVRTSKKQDARDKARWGEIVFLAVPFGALDEIARVHGDALMGKIVVDVTNALTPDMQLALGYSTSGAEQLQTKLPSARVVKCFNTVFAEHMDKGRVDDQQLTVFAASDDAEARRTVLGLAKQLGFDAVDAGPLINARSLETMGFFNIQLGYVLGHGTKMGLRLFHPEPKRG